MILVLASSADKDAAAFVSKLTDAAASLFTCFDLAVNKSSLRFPEFRDSIITLKNKEISVHEIKGVINLLPAVFPGELFFYPPEEREYQSAEFHALLTFVLSEFECPVINRPTSLSLNGPYINPMSWFHAAKNAGIPLSAMNIANNLPPERTSFEEYETLAKVTYLGGKIIIPFAARADEYTMKLARETDVEYLTAFYNYDSSGNFLFAKAQTVPDIKDPVVANALADYFYLKLS